MIDGKNVRIYSGFGGNKNYGRDENELFLLLARYDSLGDFTVNGFMRKIRRWSKRSKLLAVCDEDIEGWLASLGILDRVKDGKMQCFICKGEINISNIQIVSRVKGEIVLVCDKAECICNFTKEYKKE
jgi:hypothetical protein